MEFWFLYLHLPSPPAYRGFMTQVRIFHKEEWRLDQEQDFLPMMVDSLAVYWSSLAPGFWSMENEAFSFGVKQTEAVDCGSLASSHDQESIRPCGTC